ncbi:MAG TPA: hypothetical protein VF203_05355 [Burkholderiales bacterium]
MHEPVGPALLVWLETSGFAQAMRQWLWLYPIVEIVHIGGIVLLVGSAAMFDMRLLGLGPRSPCGASRGCFSPGPWWGSRSWWRRGS